MKISELAAIIQIAAGALIMLPAIALALGLRKEFSRGRRVKWTATTALMVFFLCGYICCIVFLLLRIPFPFELATGTIFLGGAVFVYLVMTLTKTSVNELELRSVNLKTANEELEREISSRVKTEEMLIRQEGRMRLLLDSTAEGIYGIDLNGICTFCNPSCLSLLGYLTKEELLGKNIHDLMHYHYADGSEYPKEKCLIHEAFKTRHGIMSDAEVFWKRDGTPLPVEYRAFPIIDHEKTVGVVVTFLDISERKRGEEERLKARKLESVGFLAAGIAHDFSNLLTAITGNISLAMRGLSPEEKPYQSLLKAEKACRKAGNLSGRLIALSQGGSPVLQILQIGSLVRETAAAELDDSFYTLIISTAEGLFKTAVDVEQIRQVLHSIIANAKDAMPDGGGIRVSVENAVISGDGRTTQEAYVKIAIKDGGSGIPAENLSKIFDPYFSTKEMGQNKGQGLGLTICHSIVNKHGGFITVESEPGNGSTFNVFLPAEGVR